jgi:hypothetical protein
VTTAIRKERKTPSREFAIIAVAAHRLLNQIERRDALERLAGDRRVAVLGKSKKRRRRRAQQKASVIASSGVALAMLL